MKLDRHGLVHAAHVSAEVATTYGPLLGNQVEKVTALLDRLSEQVAAIRKDTRYTAQGQHAEIDKAGRGALEDLKKVGTHPPQKLAQDLAALNCPTRLPNWREIATQRGDDPLVMYHRLREYRDFLGTLNSAERRLALVNAAEANDVLMLIAAREPSPVPLVSPDLVQEIGAMWVELQQPPEAQIIKTTAQVYDSNMATARNQIAELTGAKTEAAAA
jgi:hypothetical protein